MDLNRSPNRQSVAWFIDSIGRKLMKLDPPYQRRSVWTSSYKRFFIDTIMRNYPCPPIFLNTIVNADGIVQYFVVDGKQRLESITDFATNKIALPEKYGDSQLDGKFFDELSDVHKRKFFSYEISVENLSNFSEETINSCFDRLNRNVLKLTGQELRHAKFDGRFVEIINDIADSPFWTDNYISRPATVRRMKDVEFISELFLLTMHGIETTTSDMLDDYYAKYDEEIPDETMYRKKFDLVMKCISDLELEVHSTRLKYYSDFYTLWSVLIDFAGSKIDIAKTRENLIKFLDKAENGSKESEAITYMNAISSQPNRASNRDGRKKIMTKLIKLK